MSAYFFIHILLFWGTIESISMDCSSYVYMRLISVLISVTLESWIIARKLLTYDQPIVFLLFTKVI